MPYLSHAGRGIPANMPELFMYWYNGGVFTRNRFKSLFSLSTDKSDDVVQMARSGNSYSYNSGYKGNSNGSDYDNVIYYRDAAGNIDFTVNPKTILSAYNKFSGEKIQPSSINWAYPQDDSSRIQMSTDLKDPKKGVMPSGKSVSLPKASRSQHFAIADMLYGNSRSGKWTWHHLNDEYKMVLIDMRVHAKHGHNGGVYLWK